MTYLLTVDTGLLSPSCPPMMMKELVSSSEMAQAELFRYLEHTYIEPETKPVSSSF